MKTLVSLLCFVCFFLLMFTSVTAQQKETVLKNSVFVQQIGNHNKSTAEIFSEKSNTALFQIGSQNTSYQDIVAFKNTGTIVQAGTNNSFFHINPRLTRNQQTAVFQRGSNQNLLIVGGNGLSNNMKIAMKGTNQTIIIRNFKRQ